MLSMLVMAWESWVIVEPPWLNWVRPPVPSRPAFSCAVTSSISPSFLFKMQDQYTQLDLGLYWYQMPLVIGIWYRGIPVFKELASNDALAFLLGFKVDQFSIGYSYDLTISKLVGLTGGTHEISINYLFNQGVTKRERRKSIPCPSF